MSECNLHKYIDEINAARSRWQGKLKVFAGLELDYIKGLCCAKDKDIISLGLDFIISSVHYIVPDNGAQLFTIDGSAEELEQGIREGFGGDGLALMHAYWDAVAEMIAVGGFDILGHADLLMKNNRNSRWFNPQGEEYKSRLPEIAKAVSNCGCIAEINTGGLNRGSYTSTYPSGLLLRLFCENKVPMLISADAHKAQDIDGHYETARQTLKEAGFTEYMLFDGTVEGQPLWRRVGL